MAANVIKSTRYCPPYSLKKHYTTWEEFTLLDWKRDFYVWLHPIATVLQKATGAFRLVD